MEIGGIFKQNSYLQRVGVTRPF